MYRLGVISDTHGDGFSIREAAVKLGDVNAVAFLGDCVSDLPLIRSVFNVPVYAVSGNCDLLPEEPRETIIEIEGKRILLTHGHMYRVKMTLSMLCYRAQELKCDAALFGHTHSGYTSYDYGVLLFNPGSTAARNGTCGVLEFRENGMVPIIYNI